MSESAPSNVCQSHFLPTIYTRCHLNETVSLAEQRRLFQDRWGEVCALMQAA